MVTEVPTTTEIVCQNGGTPNGSRCHCPIQYGGRTCHRLIRDCSEPFYNHGYRTEVATLYNIQPQTAPCPFEVQCIFKWGGVVTVFRRGQGSNFDKNWEEYKEGFGDPDSGNFFVGLENLHHLLKQAKFELNIWIENVDMKNGGAFYENVTVGSESESYALSYDIFQDYRDFDADDGFSASVPMSFSARDNDVNQCYNQSGNAGWYTPNCAGFGGVFSDGYFDWPFLGNAVEVSSMSFSFVRASPLYYDD
ncbi:hypothetical protein V1264_006241 [Littorina saxatilis]|uniref:Fibrinogen C-terminal domain-containing protein n=1 Tax=Littorina saxatilis TaxID=31220 RepID=A0AAN9AXF6_9CAEN